MRAVLSERAGGPETLVVREIDDPVCGSGQLVVDVKASGVNYPDTLIIEDRYQGRPKRPFSPGGEFAGVVSAVGDEVSRFNPGDRVLGFTTWGSMAEKIAVDARQCVVIPPEMPFDEAAAFILTYGTSHYALVERGRLTAGQTLLVLGAAGGIGISSVEIGKALGARVVAAVSSVEKAELARAHGAESTIIYSTGPFDAAARSKMSRAFKTAVGQEGAHVICDAVGGDYAEAALRSIAWEGRHLVVGFPAGIPRIPLNLPLLKSCNIVGVFWGAWLERYPDGLQTQADQLFGWYLQGRLKPHISARYPLEEAGEAITHLAERRALGKVVVNVALP
jgi:NADPH:quinone reductase